MTVGATSREYRFDDEDFEALRALIKGAVGIHLSDSKKELVYGRVSRRLRALRLHSFAQYRALLGSGDPAELVEFCNAMTTNLTAFFREAHHFDYLRERLLQPLAANPRGPRRLRIWSAGCSSGEEPYSVAMTVCEAIPDHARWDIRILATDVDSATLASARLGTYARERLRNLSEQRIARFFVPLDDGRFQVSPQLAAMITFKTLNLMEPLPMKGPMDAIFCRNVIIYFDKDTQRELFTRIRRLQRAEDLLFLGHSESLLSVSNDYELVGRTIYRRAGGT